jgi:hypothetical protein
MIEIYSTDLPHIMHESIDDEVVAVNLDSGAYYSFAGVGMKIWTWLSGAGYSLQGLIDRTTAHFQGEETEIIASVTTFVGQLKDEGLVRVSHAEAVLPAEDAESGAEKHPFIEPLLQKYTDMEALLLVDPIHEVDEESGWPNQK